jgi:hypothetical protein
MKKILFFIAVVFLTSNAFALDNDFPVQDNKPIKNSTEYQNATKKILQDQEKFLHNNKAMQKELDNANQNFQELINSQR